MALSGKAAAVYQVLAGAVPTAFADEATTKDATNKRYVITNVAKRYLDPVAAVTVKKNGVVQASGFTIERVGGVVVFDNANLPGDTVVVSGTYLPITQTGGMFNWKLDMDKTLEETTTFADGGWKSYTPTDRTFTGSAEGYWANHEQFKLVTQDNPAMLVLYVGSGVIRWEMMAHFKKLSVEVPVNSVIKETIEFTGEDALYYREV